LYLVVSNEWIVRTVDIEDHIAIRAGADESIGCVGATCVDGNAGLAEDHQRASYDYLAITWVTIVSIVLLTSCLSVFSFSLLSLERRRLMSFPRLPQRGRVTHTFDNTPHRLVLPRPPFFWAGCGFTLALFSHTCVCPLVHPLCSSVPQTVTTTQYHSVWTSNSSPSSRATCLFRCFTQVGNMVFTTQPTQLTIQYN